MHADKNQENILLKKFNNILKKYDEHVDKDDVISFIEKELKESGYYKNLVDIKNVSRDIVESIDGLDNRFKELKEYKHKGGSRDTWLKDTIDKAIKKIPESEQKNVIKEIKDALLKANSDIFEGLYKIKIPAELSAPVKDYRFKDLNATAIVQNLKKDLQTNTLLGAITMEEGFKIKIDNEHEEINVVNDYFKNAVDDTRDKNFKKVVATSVQLAKNAGFKPLQDISTSEIATIVDKNVTNVKIAYKLAKGEITPIDVSDYLIDRTVSTVGKVLTDTLLPMGLKAMVSVGRTIGAIFGPVGAATGAVIGMAAAIAAGPSVKQVIVKGIQKVSKVVKNVFKSTWERITSVAKGVWQGVKSFFGF